MDVVFVDKKSDKKEKTILRLDTFREGLGTCTICQIINATPKFRANSNFQEGSVTSVGEIKDWYKEHTEDYDASIYDGKEHELKNYGEESLEDTPSVNREQPAVEIDNEL